MDGKLPEEFLRDYGLMNASAETLAEIARLNPECIFEVICLAMVIAIHAEQKKQKIREAFVDLIPGAAPSMTDIITGIAPPKGY